MELKKEVAKRFLAESKRLHGSGSYCKCEGCQDALATMVGEVIDPVEAENKKTKEALEKVSADYGVLEAELKAVKGDLEQAEAMIKSQAEQLAELQQADAPVA